MAEEDQAERPDDQNRDAVDDRLTGPAAGDEFADDSDIGQPDEQALEQRSAEQPRQRVTLGDVPDAADDGLASGDDGREDGQAPKDVE